MGVEIALQINVHVRRVLFVHLILLGMLRREGLGGGWAGGVEEGVGIEGVEKRVQVGVGLQKSALTLFLVGRQLGEAHVDDVVGLGGHFSLCSMVSVVMMVEVWVSSYSRRPGSGLTMSGACHR